MPGAVRSGRGGPSPPEAPERGDQLVGVLVAEPDHLDDRVDVVDREVRIERQRHDAAADRVGARQIDRRQTLVGLLAVDRRVEVVAGVDALGRQHRHELVAVDAEIVGLDRDREVLVGRDVLTGTTCVRMPGTSRRPSM